ncbi:prepilin-type N-terminal cleavage/methylation domain-containing protein [Oscillibacter valericigenes]|uniref:type IV pilin protein n=1 Tax=Oscillibacter valericigenes TaxID=351091 RepID=UPI001F3DFE30|nr:prepilin-type N-terminal cleavage/methylation domain-containing protein [Oscillibacter valericigenes]MCF2615665.1 prepilin-type N-terminal cleavage/methylation domain-containing protein [Oscillibacter valericigenes]
MVRRFKKGFTLAELLIVVAIIAVLVAISIPIFNSQLEKSRRAVDLHTARTIESILANAVNDGTIQFPSKMNNSSNYSVFVAIARDKNNFPLDYITKYNIDPKNDTLFCGADKSVVINNVTSTNWDKYQTEVENLLINSGLNINSLKVTSKSANNGGWDWIIVNVGYVKKVGLVTRIYSGEANKNGDASLNLGNTNIEKLINRQ